MTFRIILHFLSVVYVLAIFSCTSITVDQYPSKLPSELTLRENEPQQYSVTSHFHNRTVDGTPINSILITADYTRALDDSLVRWNNVRIGTSQDSTKPISEGNLLDCMENFTYKSPYKFPSEDIMKEEFYKDFPNNETRHLIKSLVWDAMGIETFAWMFFDNLEPNEFYQVSEFEDFTVHMGDWGSLRMKGLKLKWAGISKMNNEPCALINYRSFSNPVKSDTEAMKVNGRSLYWGSIWVSLEDKQIEYGTMNEDVLMEMTFPGNAEKMLMNMQREVSFEKML